MAVVNFFRIIYSDDNVQCPIAIMTQILLDCMTGYLVNIFQLANNNYRLKSIQTHPLHYKLYFMNGDKANLSVLSIKEARGIMIYLSTKIKNSICRYKSQFN